MANVKNITELPMAESAEGLNLIVNDGGAAKQIAASEVGAQADWTETDESSPAFIKNKPVEEWDLDVDIFCTYEEDADGNGNMNTDYTINNLNDFNNIKNKILSGIQPKCKVKIASTGWGHIDSPIFYTESFNSMFCAYYPEVPESDPEAIWFFNDGSATAPYILLLSDNTIVEIGDDR